VWGSERPRTWLGEIADEARHLDRVTLLGKRGRSVAAVVPVHDPSRDPIAGPGRGLGRGSLERWAPLGNQRPYWRPSLAGLRGPALGSTGRDSSGVFQKCLPAPVAAGAGCCRPQRCRIPYRDLCGPGSREPSATSLGDLSPRW
jgi:hypothetical protein